MTSATLYPFSRCEAGHDLTGDDAFIYDSSGTRRCRVCVSQQARAKKQGKVNGAFDS